MPVYPGYVVATAASLLLGHPVKWIEDRSENLISTGFARDYHMRGELALKSDGTMLGLRASLLADEGAFYADAQPSKFKVGLFHIVTGSYDLPAAHVVGRRGYYTNKAPGGVAYRCSFRVTEASYLIERLVQNAAYELGMDPADLRKKNFIEKDQFPYESATGFVYDSGDYHGAMDKALEMIGYDELRKEQAEARAPRASSGGSASRRSPRSSGAGPAQGLRHHRREDERRRRAPDPSDGEGDPEDQLPDAGAGSRDDVRPDRRRGAGDPARGHQGDARRHGQHAVRARHVCLPVHAHVRRGDGDGRPPRPARRRGSSRRTCSRSPRRTSSSSARTFSVKGAPDQAMTIQEVAFAAYTNFPEAWRPGSKASTTTTRRT